MPPSSMDLGDGELTLIPQKFGGFTGTSSQNLGIPQPCRARHLPLTVLRQELMRFAAFKVQLLRVFVDTTMQKITSFNIPLVSGE